MTTNYFDEDVAATYDEDEATMSDRVDLGATVDHLVALAAGGAALEFAIGTGRVALPLAARGVPVSGIELSAAMVARLRAKSGGDELAVPVIIGDMTTARFDVHFSLVYLVFNTIMNLTTQEAQVECFRNAARHLAPGGTFVVETSVPQLRQLPPGQTLVAYDVGPKHVGVDEYDVVSQQLVSHHVTTRDGRTERSSVPFRYVWPSELDLMAALAGLVLNHRWSDWTGAPFTDASGSHVSVWTKPAARPVDRK